jgi:hypothetical protein
MRPYPPDHMASGIDALDTFAPAPDLRDWIFDTFIAEGGELANPDHAHLAEAEIGVLWTNVDNVKNMRAVFGQAELMPPMAMGKWQRARAVQQVAQWFGCLPDFLLTFSAPAAAGMDDATFCALVEHELYHCGQKIDEFGMPKFRQDGSASYLIRGHDVEEFVGVVRRYGAEATGVSAMVEAASHRPLMTASDIAGACGTCLRAAA